MKKIQLILSLFLISLILNACANKQEAANAYILEPKPLNKTFKTRNISIKISKIQSPFYLKTNKIMYLADGKMSAYSQNVFADSLSNYLNEALNYKLITAKFARAIISDEGFKTDYELEIRVDSWLQVFKENSSSVQARVGFSLFKNNELVNQSYATFEDSVQAQGVQASVQSFENLLNLIAESAVIWLDTNLP